MRWLMLMLIAGTFIAYTLPWLVHPGTGLTFGAYDLAEWTSLHPEVRFGSPELFASLLLRMPLACIATLLAFNAGRLNTALWWVSLIAAGLLLAISFPPLEFVTEARNDPNYLQQFFVTIMAGLACVIGLSGLMARFKRYIVAGVALVALTSGFMGLEQANRLMIGFSMPVQRGAGIFLFIMLCACVIAVSWRYNQDGAHIHHPAH